ncbi:MAG: 3alpha(or 20beta)-hydroxysteroid dehydrogenase [Candidatus Poriferisodalaceae bacterium]|jgi:3alpha(or 20beta)-hydroxysteroid dehydrogenase
MGKLDGKVAFITGGARGQGAAEGRMFAEEGATVVLTDVLDEVGEKTAGELGCDYLHLDVSDEASWDAAVADVMGHHGKIDVLVNNAGIFAYGTTLSTPVADFRKMMDINCTGVFLGMQKVGRVMTEAGSGVMVNISSVAGLSGTQGAAAYSASKWAVRGMTKTAAKEMGRKGVRVNSVHPGWIDTDMLDQVHDFDDGTDRTKTMLKSVPLGRVAEPDEVARLVLFLACGDSSYCTGQEFTVDGGMYC